MGTLRIRWGYAALIAVTLKFNYRNFTTTGIVTYGERKRTIARGLGDEEITCETR